MTSWLPQINRLANPLRNPPAFSLPVPAAMLVKKEFSSVEHAVYEGIGMDTGYPLSMNGHIPEEVVLVLGTHPAHYMLPAGKPYTLPQPTVH